MGDNEKLDLILAAVRDLQARVDELSDQNEELREAISDLGLPDGNFSVFRPEED